MPWCHAASKPLDDAHRTAAAGAGMLRRLLFVGLGAGVLGLGSAGFDGVDRNYRRRSEQQFASAGDILGPLAAVEHSVIADAVET